MILRGSYGGMFELVILGYQSPPEVADHHDRNRLNIMISASAHTGAWGGVAPCLLTWEAVRLCEWLRGACKFEAEPFREFAKPDLAFEYVWGEPEILIRVTTRFALNMGTPGNDPIEGGRVVNLTLFPQILLDSADDLQAEASAFPER